MRFTYPESLIATVVVGLMILLLGGFTYGLVRGDTKPHWTYYSGDDPVAFDSRTGRACRARPGVIVCIDYENHRVTQMPLGQAKDPFAGLPDSSSGP